MNTYAFNAILAAALPLGAIALGWWSFRWQEKGATPDAWGVESIEGREEEMLAKGERYRDRWWARTTFNAGAMLLAASVPIGQATQHTNYSWLIATGGYAIILWGVLYFALQTCNVWQSWREDAFDIYFEPMMWRLYDQSLTRQIYFRENQMPIWEMFDPNWAAKRKKPDIKEVYEKASITEPPEQPS
jgi:hypothetical protein